MQTIVVGSGAGQDELIVSSELTGLPLNVGSRPKSKSENSKNGKLNFALELDLPHYLKWPQRADAAVVTPQRTRPKDKKEPQIKKTISKTSKRSKSSQADGKVYYIWKLNYLDLR